MRAQHTDSLYEVLLKLRENRVSMITIERQYHHEKTQTEQIETVGLVFLTDLMFILKQVNFHEILTRPIIDFVLALNGTDEDKRAYKDKLRAEGSNNDVTDQNSLSHTNSLRRP